MIESVNSFYSKGRQGGLNYEAVPLSPFLNPLNPSHVQSACNGADALHVIKNYDKFYLSNQISVRQILKFHERVISALILVASFAKPKISSQFLRVSENLKFAKTIFLEI
ncbi:hypothetical protein B9N65_08390 [Campylobacter concisus]|uniref:Uncharacterized protein n=1 Tax=Campylobacter concisus TaxID=199 RepID=A0A1Y5MF87_9BACT|nr:hypothetical protein B9N65_08390 [Campylobacter concisus]